MFVESSDYDHDAIQGDVVEKVRSMMPPDKDFYDLSNLYKMFADNTRLQILWALNCSEMCSGDLAELLSMSRSAISHQLKSLRLANTVEFRREGKIVYYSLKDCHIKDIFEQGFEHIHE